MATGLTKKELDEYFAEARSWDHDRMLQARRSQRLAWIVAAVAGGLAIAGTAAVAMLSPLKTVEPYVVTIDRMTGATDVSAGLVGDSTLTYNEAIAKYFLAQYVRYREGWIPQAREEFFTAVVALSSGREGERYARSFDAENPRSPQNVYGVDSYIAVQITNITFIGENVAQVRFIRDVERGSATVREVRAIATNTYQVTGEPTGEEAIINNPLGYRVTDYRSDVELVVNTADEG